MKELESCDKHVYVKTLIIKCNDKVVDSETCMRNITIRIELVYMTFITKELATSLTDAARERRKKFLTQERSLIIMQSHPPLHLLSFPTCLHLVNLVAAASFASSF